MTATRTEKRNVFLLAACLALGMSVSSLIMTAAAVVGTIVAPTRALATMPLAFMFVAMMLTTLPASLLMQRIGRRGGFMLGAAAGAVGGALSATAVHVGSFALFCIGMVLLGISNAFVQYYRFAAADVSSEEFRPTAISWVMAGGVAAALIGPNLANWTKDSLGPVLFVGTFATLPVLQAAIMVLLPMINLPRPPRQTRQQSGRPLSEIARQPLFLVAVLGAVVGYAGMNFVMVATPLAILDCDYEFADAAFILQWHVLGMYVPAFFTGPLIKRYGAPRVMLTGAVFYLVCVALNLAGTDLLLSFWPALVFLGIGWNFLFVGGTALLTKTYRPEEKGKVQGLNDFVVFTVVAASALTSGTVHATAGWATVNLVLLGLTALVVVVLVWAVMHERRQSLSAAA